MEETWLRAEGPVSLTSRTFLGGIQEAPAPAGAFLTLELPALLILGRGASVRGRTQTLWGNLATSAVAN